LVFGVKRDRTTKSAIAVYAWWCDRAYSANIVLLGNCFEVRSLFMHGGAIAIHAFIALLGICCFCAIAKRCCFQQIALCFDSINR